MSGLDRAEFESFWERLDAEALAAKFSQEATIRLASFYRGLDEDDRAVVDAALAEWVSGENARRRFDALALIHEFEIRSAVPALRERMQSLAGAAEGPLADERARTERIVAALS